jgi:SAM-dependent methyltransferase
VANARFEERDAARIGERHQYDLITAFDAIHDQIEPARVLDEIAAALRPDGLFLMQDIAASSHVEKNETHPLGPFLYTVSCMHCMTVSLSGGGAGLGAVWGEELALRMLGDAGFGDVVVKRLPHDIINNYYLARPRR